MPHPFAAFYRGKRVLVTGHTGFQGGWLVAWLKLLGAQVCGYGLPPATRPNFFDATLLDRGITSIFGDIRDRNSLANTFTEFQPEIVVHAAAQASPPLSNREPVDTFSTNVMGTVHVLDEARLTHSVRAVVLVSSASCYMHRDRSLHEEDSLGAHDSYAASIACAELAASGFTASFFQNTRTAIATSRAPDAIGGGDWGEGRMVPDLVRALVSEQPSVLREGGDIALWHVLESHRAYLLLAQQLFECGQQYSGAWNFGPHDDDMISGSALAKNFIDLWGAGEVTLEPETSVRGRSPTPRLSTRKAQKELGWSSALGPDQTIAWTVEWYRAFYADTSSACRTTENQLQQYMRITMA